MENKDTPIAKKSNELDFKLKLNFTETKKSKPTKNGVKVVLSNVKGLRLSRSTENKREKAKKTSRKCFSERKKFELRKRIENAGSPDIHTVLSKFRSPIKKRRREEFNLNCLWRMELNDSK